ncbi:cytochrome P450 [Phascolomyces articulosus]|uniref:Cytochrome P450 n=1 Tax=Phascolomyces articulosus TaxID=60185 RepID=A0AAD5P9V0_9FUNG|nr:cytochrome P450 [Phascolomyces articulosus]
MEPVSKVWASQLLPYVNNVLLKLLDSNNGNSNNGTVTRKIISISAALFLFYITYDKVMRPPKQLRHITHGNPIKTLMAALRQLSADEITRSIGYPLSSQTENGLYTRFDATGWTVIINDPAIAKEYLFKSTTFVKSPLSDDFAGTLITRFIVGPNILFLSGQHWLDQRKIANPAFRRSMPVALFGRLTEKLFNVIDTTGDTSDVYDLMERWTLDALGNAGFGFDFDAISSKQNKWVKKYNDIINATQNPIYGLFPILERRFLNWIPSRKKSHQDMDEFHDMIQCLIDKKRKLIQEQKESGISVMGDPERDLLTMMIEGGQEEGQGLTDAELLSNVYVFLFAGHDTTASAISFAICFLAMYPEIQQRAREEAIKILGDEPKNVAPTVEQSQKMVYTEQIIKETLRMYAPVDYLVPRCAVKDTELGGVFIPKGTQVTVSIYQLHHSPRVWNDNPDKFNPDRFASNTNTSSIENYDWIPFSTGARKCIGMNFSLSEQRLFLPMLLRKYVWRLPKDTIHSPERIVTKQNLGVMSPKNLNVIFERRY